MSNRHRLTSLATVVLFVLSSTLALGADDSLAIRDGIYTFEEEGKGQRIQRSDPGGGVIYLADWLTDRFGKASIKSIANDNSRFLFQLTGAGPMPDAAHQKPLALVIGGACFVIGSHSELDAERKTDLQSTIAGESTAKLVAKQLGVEILLRKHPGHRLVVTFKPDKEKYEPKEPVTLTMTIKNVGDMPVAFTDGGMQRGPRNNQFGFTAFPASHGEKALPDIGDPSNFGGLAGLITLAPGEIFRREAQLSDWFQFNKPGSYLVTGTYRLALHRPDGWSHPSIWDDFAVGECTVYIPIDQVVQDVPELHQVHSRISEADFLKLLENIKFTSVKVQRDEEECKYLIRTKSGKNVTVTFRNGECVGLEQLRSKAPE